ncbi:TPA: hypothetical protein PXC22_000839 [Staphylococcus aureus]|nr:hypothetical protein [Staphylococcus aureus]ATZ14540.1 hypothetical protein CU118_06155 [Staphylococcus aureus]HCU8997089.1 hypothetical protein [Staphylococcus aureus]HDJ3073215.1 hypothetical protein [Staphylococcus aureus]HDJ7727090.1 hypothetical protein [Staphylococcus aureus]HDL4820526.1 hypothetical protein [Staphylococcus aureus]
MIMLFSLLILIETTHLITFVFKQLLFIFNVPFTYPYKKEARQHIVG